MPPCNHLTTLRVSLNVNGHPHKYLISVSSLTPDGWTPLDMEEIETAYTCHELRMILRALGRLVPVLLGTTTGAYRIEARDSETHELSALSEYRLTDRVSEWISCERIMQEKRSCEIRSAA